MILAGLALVAASCTASDPAGAPSFESYRDLVDRIVREALARGQAYEKLGELCRVAPRRLSGTDDASRAVEWGREVMIRDGLHNVRLEPVLVPRWDRGGTERLEIVEPAELAGEPLRITALGGSIATAGEGLVAPILEAHDFEELAEQASLAAGKIVLFNRPLDPTRINTFAAYGGAVNQRSRGAIEAARAGGVGALVRSMTLLLDDSPHTGAMRYEEGVERVPAAAVSTLGAERLSSLLDEHGRVVVRLALDCRTLPDVPSHNVVGELVGTTWPEEVIVVGGHLDAWDIGEGAHDDGAGCCHALEALRLLRAVGFEPKRTIRVVLFMNEENGVRGGRAYYERYLGAMDRHVFALESDRGGFTPRGFSTDANPRALAVLREIGALLEPIGADRVVPGGGGVDIGPMTRSGVITMGLVPDSQRYFDVHHSENDVFESVNERELELGAAAVACMLAIVSDLPEPLPRNEPATR